MSDFTKLQKDKILNYLYKNFKKIDFDNIDQDIFLKKIGDLVFFDKKELLLKIGSLFFEDLDKRFLTEIKSKINTITKTNEKISFLLNKRFQVEKKNKDLIKKIFIHLIKNNNSNKVLNYIYSVADTMWKHSNDRSVDFNYYTKRLILSSVYLKILILIFYRENLTDKDHIRGALKAYRKECFEQIGGLRTAMGWDTVDELLCKFYNWKVKTDESLQVKHLKPTGANYNKASRYKQGEAFYSIGYGFWITAIASLKLALRKRKPLLFIDYIKGFWKAKSSKKPLLVTQEQARFIRNYRWKKMKEKIFRF